jgi:hypothetical protein
MNKYSMAKPNMQKLIMTKINMNETLMAKIKMVKILMKNLVWVQEHTTMADTLKSKAILVGVQSPAPNSGPALETASNPASP